MIRLVQLPVMFCPSVQEKCTAARCAGRHRFAASRRSFVYRSTLAEAFSRQSTCCATGCMSHICLERGVCCVHTRIHSALFSPAPAVRKRKQPQPGAGPRIRMGSAALDRLWNQAPDNMSGLKVTSKSSTTFLLCICKEPCVKRQTCLFTHGSLQLSSLLASPRIWSQSGHFHLLGISPAGHSIHAEAGRIIMRVPFALHESGRPSSKVHFGKKFTLTTGVNLEAPATAARLHGTSAWLCVRVSGGSCRHPDSIATPF